MARLEQASATAAVRAVLLLEAERPWLPDPEPPRRQVARPVQALIIMAAAGVGGLLAWESIVVVTDALVRVWRGLA